MLDLFPGMKHQISFLLVLLLCASCGNQEGKQPEKTVSGTDSLVNSSGASAPIEVREGAKLITSNDCFTCHQLEQKLVGPSYKDIARKYPHVEGVVSNLASGIVRGSKGVWGPEVMTPHPNVTHEQAREMVLYIFSLDSTHTKDTTGTRPAPPAFKQKLP